MQQDRLLADKLTAQHSGVLTQTQKIKVRKNRLMSSNLTLQSFRYILKTFFWKTRKSIQKRLNSVNHSQNVTDGNRRSQVIFKFRRDTGALAKKTNRVMVNDLEKMSYYCIDTNGLSNISWRRKRIADILMNTRSNSYLPTPLMSEGGQYIIVYSISDLCAYVNIYMNIGS